MLVYAAFAKGQPQLAVVLLLLGHRGHRERPAFVWKTDKSTPAACMHFSSCLTAVFQLINFIRLCGTQEMSFWLLWASGTRFRGSTERQDANTFTSSFVIEQKMMKCELGWPFKARAQVPRIPLISVIATLPGNRALLRLRMRLTGNPLRGSL
ncbi:hypothetical protein Baya_10768 [Bagarius yarrelli]|uniref:Uncharacterized protein n=1 Tax=Bagarius yarrelli TaxID=175774 RepID=A0A556UZA1_BAGYA|nr:hypothetical protein Baya_10768 [Bagarius yarrelli]